MVLLDEDEPKEALENGDITQMDFDLAYNKANRIMNGIARDVTYLSDMGYNNLKNFRTQLNRNAY